MARFCSNCGMQLTDNANNCPGCGKPAPSVGGGAQAAPTQSGAGGLADNVAGMLAYVTIVPAIIFLVIEPYSRNRVIRFHAFQSIFAWIAAIVIGMVLSTISYIFVSIPFIGWIIYILLWTAFSLGILGLWLFLMYKAYNKERFVLPVVGAWAEKQAQS